ncbi:MAG: peroxiredoxin [Actinomycetota bacterium]|nr:peroxiredoxin [Actinomycetota bacterium]
MSGADPPPGGAGPPEQGGRAAPGRPGSGGRLAKGDPAPGFELPGTGGRSYSLAEHRGKVVVLVFYPADNSPVCTQQLRSYSEDMGVFERLGATVLCLSPQDRSSHEEFARRQGLALPLLADTDRSVARSYGVLGPLGFYRRSIFVVGADGLVRFARRSLSSLTYMPADQLARTVREATVAAG